MSVVEDVRKVQQDFLAPELRSISERMNGLQKQLDAAERQRAEDKADILRVITGDKADILGAISEGNAHMEKRFELVIDYTKVLQRMDKLEEKRKAESH